MRIAQVAPLHESVPPRLYGGTERVVSYLTEELVRQGHDVTLYASGDSRTTAQLRPMCERALRLEGGSRPGAHVDPLARHLLLIEVAAREADHYDIVHFHLDCLPFSLIRRTGMAAVNTVHSRLDVPDLHPLLREFRDMRLISVSDAQRAPARWASWLATVHHGLPETLHRPCYRPDGYLAFIGRISPEKRLDLAAEIARRAGKQLRVAAKIDSADREYVETIRGYLGEPHVEFIGEIDERQKTDFLGRAEAMLLPIDWPEPFGLVMIESLACGTPVIAFRRGSVEEIIEDGVSGFIVDSVEEAVEAVRRIPLLDREACRLAFERRFSATRMCEEYLRVYEQVIGRQKPAARSCRDLSLIS